MMNLPTLVVLLLLAVALFFALRSYLRAGRSGSCGCSSGGSDGCGSSSSSSGSSDGCGPGKTSGHPGISACHGCPSASGCPFCSSHK